MAATIAQIIGKVNPELYAENGKELLKKYGSPEEIPAEEVIEKPTSQHELVYDSSSETLEPVYFFILDLMGELGLKTEKLMDNFTSSPGSGHFAELGQRATIMQQQGMKILGDVNTVLRSVLNLIYDLKEFRIRLAQYDDLKTERKEAAMLSLKQLWMDKVDINKQNSSIKAMALGQAGFQTLMDAFLFVKELKEVDKVDLNDRVKRILRARILEFGDWLNHSEKELRKRYILEKTYLKSQVNSLKLYSRWAKPYLNAAQQLEMNEKSREPALAKVFNTIILELSLLAKRKLDVVEKAKVGDLPRELEKIKTKTFYSCSLVDFVFRGIPQRVSQQSHYTFGGRASVTFKSYALTGEEIEKINQELEDSDLGTALKLIEGTTTESLDQLQDEIDFFLEEVDQDEVSSGSGSEDGSNPFKALFGGYAKKPKEKKKSGLNKEKQKKIILKKDNFVEKGYVRPLARVGAEATSFLLFDVYKKSHSMPSYSDV